MYAALGGYLGVLGLKKAGVAYLKKSIELADHSGDLGELAFSSVVYALYLVGIGDWQHSLQYSRSCQANAEKVESQVTLCNALVISFWNHYYKGTYADARAISEHLIVVANKAGSIQQEIWGHNGCAIVCLTTGAEAEAKSHLWQALTLLNIIDQLK